MNTISLLIVEDHTMVREGFRMVLKLEKDIEIVGEALNGREVDVDTSKSSTPSFARERSTRGSPRRAALALYLRLRGRW